MPNYFKDNPDLQFYIDQWINWDAIFEVTERFGYAKDSLNSKAEAVEFYRDILELVGQFVGDEIAPHSSQIDREGVSLVDGEVVFPERLESIFEGLKALELHGMNLPRELGGQNCPMLLYMIQMELFTRADTSVTTHYGFHGGIAMALLLFSIREGTTTYNPETGEILETRFADAIEEIRTGNAWGSMDITEPDAGSDMAKLRCIGELDADGNWHVTGQKIFITSGHGKYHFVIARTEKPETSDNPMAVLQGLSFFLVPAFTDDADGNRVRTVTVDRLEEKMGHHGSATCAVSFDKSPAMLIGQRGEGFKYMLTLMNNARVGVGFECLGLCESAYRIARDYAAERPSMGKTIDRHEMIADYLDEMQSDIEGIRALAMEAGTLEELAARTEQLCDAGVMDTILKDDSRAQSHRRQLKKRRQLARRYTPLLKYVAAEKAVDHARRAVQILGGVGYTKEYPAEQLMRDATVMPIYEGTSQIQSLMAMKDTMGAIIKNPQTFIKRRAQMRWRAMSARTPIERRVAKLQSISLSVQQHLVTRTAADKFSSLQGKPISGWPSEFLKNWDPKRDFSYAMLHAERLTRILVDEAICEILLAQSRQFPERQEVLERYLERAEPRCRYLHDQITNSGDRLLERLRDEEDQAEQTAV